MKTNLLNKLDTTRRPKMAVSAHVALDDARARVIAAGVPSLKALRAKFGNWDAPEVSGQCVAKQAK